MTVRLPLAGMLEWALPRIAPDKLHFRAGWHFLQGVRQPEGRVMPHGSASGQPIAATVATAFGQAMPWMNPYLRRRIS
jgi:hypothetical protein